MRVRRRMREVVHRIDAPRVAGAMVMRAADAVEHRVAHVDVRRRHVDLRAQHVRAVRELAGAHAREQVEVLLDRRGRDTGCRGPARSACRGTRGSRRPSGCRRRPCPARSGARRSRRAARSSPRRRAARRPSRSPSQRTSSLIESTYSTSSFVGVGVVEAQVAGAAELARRRRSSGRSTWRGRCAGSRSAPAGSAWRHGRRASPR